MVGRMVRISIVIVVNSTVAFIEPMRYLEKLLQLKTKIFTNFPKIDCVLVTFTQ